MFANQFGNAAATPIDVRLEPLRLLQLLIETFTFRCQRTLQDKKKEYLVVIRYVCRKRDKIWLYLLLLAANRLQIAFSLRQTLGEREQQAGYVTHIIDVGAELGGFAGTHLLR